jgi:hypothetical protein
MNEIYAQRLAQIVGREGVPAPAAAQELERRLAAGEQPTPPSVRALAVVLETKAVDYLQRWHAHTGSKRPYADVRQYMAGKLAQAGLLDEAMAHWALDAWQAALTASPAAPRAAPAVAAVAGPIAAAEEDEAPLEEGQRFEPGGIGRPAGYGWRWFKGAWQLFAQAWPRWLLAQLLIGLMIGAIAAAIGLAAATVVLLPVAVLLLPIAVLGYFLFNAGLLRCVQRLDQEGRFEMADLFYGFRYRVGAQVGASLLWIVGWLLTSLVVVAVFMLVLGASLASLQQLPTLRAFALAGTGVVLWLGALGVAGIAMLPLYGAQLLTPALVVLGDQPAMSSVLQAIRGSYRNFLPQIVFGLVLLAAIALVAVALALLGKLGVPNWLYDVVMWFVLGPFSVCSIYAAYRDIYFDAADR